jgi:hypothetical protein
MEGSRKHSGFESQWSVAFDGAEMQPSPQVWKNIDGALANQQVGFYKKRVFWYQMLTAASLVLALGLAFIFFLNDKSTNGVLANNKILSQESIAKSDKSDPSDLGEVVTIDESNTNTTDFVASEKADMSSNSSLVSNGTTIASKGDANISRKSDNSIGSKNQSLLVAMENESDKDSKTALVLPVVIETTSSEINTSNEKRAIDSFISMISAKSYPSSTEVSAGVLPEFFYKIPVYKIQEVVIDPEKIESSGLWAGVNMSSGTFDPNYSQSESFPTLQLREANFIGAAVGDPGEKVKPLEEESESGVSFTVGVEIGKRIAPRWILQSGFQYGTYDVNSKTNQFFKDGVSDSKFPVSFQNQETLFGQDNLNFFNDEISIRNRFRMVSIPVKAGYIVLDKKFNVILNGGLSADFYIGNTLSSNDENVGEYKIDAGDSSPYRSTNLSALSGVQFGYKVGDNIYLSLEPNYRAFITEFAKNGEAYTSNPARFGVAFGFRYTIK